MKYVIIGICIVAVAVIVALLIYRKKKTSSLEGENKSNPGNDAMMVKKTNELSQADQNLAELVIQMEMLPIEAIPDENKLVEITDSKVLTRVNNLVPGLAQAGVPDHTKYHLAQAMLSYINRSVDFNDGLHFVDESIDYDRYKSVFYSIFNAMHQSQHFKHMMEEAE